MGFGFFWNSDLKFHECLGEGGGGGGGGVSPALSRAPSMKL